MFFAAARRRYIGVLVFGALLCLLVYIPCLDAPFVWDDLVFLADNAALEQPVRPADFLTRSYFELSQEASWRPLATLSYVLQLRAFGESPGLMRSVGLALHLLNALLLFGALRAFRLPPRAGALAAALFLLHPAHVETLMCVTFNEELLAACGLLVFAWAHRRGNTSAAAAGGVCAMLAKETGALGIVLAAAGDYFWGGSARLWERRRAYAVYAAVTAVYAGVRFIALKGPGAEAGVSLPLAERLYYGLQGVVTAVRIFVLPAALRIDYFALPAQSPLEVLGWLFGGACVVFAAVLLWRRLREERAVLAWAVWPLVFLGITSNLLPFNLLSTRYMAERWLYLPYIGLAVVAAWFLVKRPRLAALLLLVWAGSAGARGREWCEGARLWGGLVRIYPWSAKAREGLGESYYRGGRYALALAEFTEAAALRRERTDRLLAHYEPMAGGALKWESPSLHRWLGRTHLKTGDMFRAAADFTRAAELDPQDAYSYRIMAYHFARSGRFDEALDWQRRGLERFPDDEFLRRLRADIAHRRLSFRAAF